MNPIILLNSISFLILAALCILIYAHTSKRKDSTFGRLIGLISIFYFASAILNILWFLNILSWGKIDSIIVGSSFIMPSAAILLVALYRITGEKRLLFFLAIFTFSLFGFGMRPLEFLVTLIMLSFVLIILSAIELFILKSPISKSGGFMISYGFTSFVLACLILKFNFPPLWFIPNIMLAVGYLLFLKNIGNMHDCNGKAPEKQSFFGAALKYFIFIITLLIFVLFSTISLHEMGHGFSANLLGCESKSVIFEANEGSFTEVNCINDNDYARIALGGILMPLLFGLLMLISGGSFVKNMGRLIISVALFITYSDLRQLSISLNYVIPIYIFSSCFALFSVIRLANAYIKRNPCLTKQEKKKNGQKKESGMGKIGAFFRKI